jgi:hypothetical protein
MPQHETKILTDHLLLSIAHCHVGLEPTCHPHITAALLTAWSSSPGFRPKADLPLLCMLPSSAFAEALSPFFQLELRLRTSPRTKSRAHSAPHASAAAGPRFAGLKIRTPPPPLHVVSPNSSFGAIPIRLRRAITPVPRNPGARERLG